MKDMITYVPNYYSRFSCIAGKCQHTCCKGWEIDIDAESMKRFSSDKSIMKVVEEGSFVLQGDEERCPFLREDNLCQMIIDHGENFICDICKDHPRFRNYYDDRIEMGIGLCCEVACDLIIGNTELFELVPDRKLPKSINTLKVRGSDIMERFALIASVKLDPEESSGLYKQMERLDRNWDEIIDTCERDRKKVSAYIREHSIEFEQIAIYYAYRYPRIPSFAVEACSVIAGCAITLGGSTEDIKESARMYSSEVEYSDENMDLIYEIFEA